MESYPAIPGGSDPAAGTPRSGEQGGEQGMDIDGMVQGPADPDVLERPPSGVDGDVEIPEGRTPLQLLAVSALPALGLADRHLDHAQLTGLVLGGLGQRLGNDPDPQGVGAGAPPQ